MIPSSDATRRLAPAGRPLVHGLGLLLLGLALAAPAAAQQTTLGGGTAGEGAARLPDSYKAPTGPPPRLPSGFTRLDTKGNPHSDKMKLTQRFTRTDPGHISYVVTIDDPVYCVKPWTNQRTFTLTSGNLMEYSCEENNRSMGEGRIKLWVPPSSEQPRLYKPGQP